jgi:hypothetical protein
MEKTDKGKVEPFPRHWLEKYTEEQLERLAIMTVDGNLTDERAEKALERSEKK